MTCTLSIVECLRQRGIYPTASAKGQSRTTASPSNALNYTLANNYDSANDGTEQWISFDFKTRVALKSY